MPSEPDDKNQGSPANVDGQPQDGNATSQSQENASGADVLDISSIAKDKSKKKSPNDPDLGLVKKAPVTKKMLRLMAFAVAAMVFFGLIIGLSSSHKGGPNKDQLKKDQALTQQIPDNLNPNADDYGLIKPVRVDTVPPGSIMSTAGKYGSQNTANPSYQAYPTNPQNPQQVQFPTQQQQQGNSQQPQEPTAKNPSMSFAAFATNSPDEETKRRLAALTSGFFFPWQSAEQQAAIAKQVSTAQQQAEKQAQAQTDALASAYESPYSKENMSKEKQDFVSSQQADYGAYLDNHYLSPVDAQHLLTAGTLIPIVMETGINSDLPGTIISQVIEPVFDSLTGQNILIPRGSKLIGTYDNTVSFGQNRVFVAWQRLIRTDGISISLRGMKGTDLQGQAGLHDSVDYHLATILAVVGASTLFNIGTNAAIAALSTNQFLSGLANAMTAQGNSSSNVTSAATNAATEYASKLISEQPTITIRPGIRANCLIDKDMILPAFVDQEGGYAPAQ